MTETPASLRRLFLLLTAAGFIAGAVAGGALGVRLAAGERSTAVPARFDMPSANADRAARVEV